MESFPEITYFCHGIFAPFFMNQIGSQLKHNPLIFLVPKKIAKGQLISKGLFGVIVWTKNPTKIF